MPRLKLILGTRGSRLALAQSNATADAIRGKCPSVNIDIRIIKTTGDIDRTRPFASFGNTGLFVKEIEQLMLDEEIDLAVHSMKDVPTEMDDRLTLGAVPGREDPRDALLSRKGTSLQDLPEDAVIGTSSPRRRALVWRQRPELRLEELRGNVDTRIKKLDEGQYDAIILAVAGLTRLGLADRVTEAFDVETMVPAPGQGALAIQVRKADDRLTEILHALDVPVVAAAVRAERAFLARLGGGCQMPIGAFASVEDGRIALTGYVSDPEGKLCFQGKRIGSQTEPEAVGTQLAEQLLAEGASSVVR